MWDHNCIRVGKTAQMNVTALVATGPTRPVGPGYDLVLLAHVACVLVGGVSVLVSGVEAARVRRIPPGEGLPDSIRRYFAPGVNWAGRALYGVPVLGFVLLAMSRGAFSTRDAWVITGLMLWVGVAVGAEGLMWPAERQLQRRLNSETPKNGSTVIDADVIQLARTVCAVAGLSFAVLVAGSILMVAKP
jgi:uncharacterized membrane protein